MIGRGLVNIAGQLALQEQIGVRTLHSDQAPMREVAAGIAVIQHRPKFRLRMTKMLYPTVGYPAARLFKEVAPFFNHRFKPRDF